MAIKTYYIGTEGPFFYDDTESRPDGTTVMGFQTDDNVEVGGLIVVGSTAHRRLVEDDEQGRLAEVADLGFFIKGTANQVDVVDNGDGTVTIGLIPGAAVPDPAALTSTDVDPGTVTLSDLATQYNNLRADVVAIHTTLTALLTVLRNSVITP